MKRALVVEDLPSTAEWLAQTVREAFPGVVVSLASSVAGGRKCLRSQRPDLALIDLGLPDGSGVDLIALIASDAPDCHCIVTTIFQDDQHLFPALRAGAQGYLLKDQPREHLVRALQGMAAGEPPLSAPIAKRLLRVFDRTESTNPDARLSPREVETLTLIAKGFRLPDLVEHLGVTRNTAAGFIKSVYRKLNISSRAEATLEAARLGLVRTDL